MSYHGVGITVLEDLVRFYEEQISVRDMHAKTARELYEEKQALADESRAKLTGVKELLNYANR